MSTTGANYSSFKGIVYKKMNTKTFVHDNGRMVKGRGSHSHEPVCAIREEVSSGVIGQRRYLNTLKRGEGRDA